jgi:tRNA nucleotidyltransferase (CCA-adding enzyme)
MKLNIPSILSSNKKKKSNVIEISGTKFNVPSISHLLTKPYKPSKLIKPIKRKANRSKIKVKRAAITKFNGKDHDIKSPENIKKITYILNNNGGRCYIVGGYVRDVLLDKKPKDVDIEVHGLTLDEISLILKKHGYKVDEVGKSFGVLKVKGPETKGIIDIAVPRTDSTGRKPDVSFLRNATPLQAAKRRDLTINAIMYDTKSDKVVDPFSGIKDLEQKKIRHVSEESFRDDPLRIIRAAQFASRFGFTIDPETKKLAREVDSSKMAPERVTEEMRKVFAKSKKPSIFFNELDDMHQLERLFPEIKQLQNTKQDPIHHPEGNAYIHTMEVMDRISESDKRKLELLVAALLHDLGKITMSVEDPSTKRIHARGHEVESEIMARKILNKYKFTNNEIRDILSIVKHHMKPHSMIFENALKLKHKHRLMRDICTTKGMIKDPSGSIRKYCDVIDFSKQDRPKDEEKYEELKKLPPLNHYISDTTGNELYAQGYRGKEIGDLLEERYLSKINHLKKENKEDLS